MQQTRIIYLFKAPFEALSNMSYLSTQVKTVSGGSNAMSSENEIGCYDKWLFCRLGFAGSNHMCLEEAMKRSQIQL